jgi:hypothetical protein
VAQESFPDLAHLRHVTFTDNGRGLCGAEAMQDDLDEWLVHYNSERPHLGDRIQSRGPLETVKSFVSQEG